MKTLPNGVKVFNGTPHSIRFWNPDWDAPVEVEPDGRIDARPEEEYVSRMEGTGTPLLMDGVFFVRTKFVGTDKGREIVARAYARGADVVVGSIIAAQAYPGQVVAMTPAPGYERVPPAEKRMNPDKFNIF